MDTSRKQSVDLQSATGSDSGLHCQSDINQKLHILIVDSNPLDCELIKTYLGDVDALVVAAQRVDKALECVKWLKPDLVLCELSVEANLDGLNLCREFKSAPFIDQPSVLFVSSQTDKQQLSIEAGADGFISKPFDKKHIIRIVKAQTRFKQYVKELPGSTHQGTKTLSDQTSKQQRASSFTELKAPELMDTVADCFNRTAFKEYVGYLIDSQQSDEEVGAFVQIHINNLSLVNECSGFAAGDELMREVVNRIERVNQGEFFLARLQGKQFALVAPRLDKTKMRRMLNEIKVQLNSEPFVYDSLHLSLDAEVAIHLIDRNLDNLDQLYFLPISAGDDLLNQQNIYESILLGVDETKPKNLPVINWAKTLMEGLENNRFEVFVQQISCVNLVHYREDELKFEALVRLRDDEGGFHQPGLFIPAAERLHLVSSIDRVVITKVLEFFNANPADMSRLHSISINLAASTLFQDGLKEFVRDSCLKYNVDPSALVFELTETQNIVSAEKAREIMLSIKELGCRFALDDFGTGYASFTFMLELPFDIVKIDGSLIREMSEGSLALTMVNAIVHIAHSVGASVVAEYVESVKILSQLSSLDIDWGQGYAIHRPEPLVPGLFDRLLNQ